MTIVDGMIDGTYTVTDISMEGPIMRRLESLGINSGTKLRLMNRKRNGTVIIKVRGTRWAIGKDIAGGILVNPAEGEDANGSN